MRAHNINALLIIGGFEVHGFALFPLYFFVRSRILNSSEHSPGRKTSQLPGCFFFKAELHKTMKLLICMKRMSLDAWRNGRATGRTSSLRFLFLCLFITSETILIFPLFMVPLRGQSCTSHCSRNRALNGLPVPSTISKRSEGITASSLGMKTSFCSRDSVKSHTDSSSRSAVPEFAVLWTQFTNPASDSVRMQIVSAVTSIRVLLSEEVICSLGLVIPP